jgi:serine/threonine protein kinase
VRVPKEISLDQTLYSVALDCQQCGAHFDRPDAVCSCGALLVTGLNPGSIIGGRYIYTATIGNGGMGLIVKAHDPVQGCDVALKLLLRNSNSGEVTRFMQECKATAILSHPCIIKINEYGVTNDGYPFMAMEFLPGEDLGTRIARHGALELPEALEIFNQLCDTMSYAHSKGVVHRDLKPSNIMIQQTPDGRQRITVVDFGIAKVVDPDGTSADLTRTGQIVGSPLYMSPEQSLGKKIDFRTDIYSAGCVLFHALTGAPPIHGESSIETLFKHVNEVPPSMAEASLGKRFPAPLEAVVAKTLKKDPAERYQTFDELKQALSAALRPGAVAEGQKGTAKIRRQNEKFPTALLIAVAALLFIGALGYLWFQSSQKSSVTRPGSAASDLNQSPAAVGGEGDKGPNLDDFDQRKTAEHIVGEEIFSGGVKPLIDYDLESQDTSIDLAQPGTTDDAIKYLIRRLKATGVHLNKLNLNRSQITDASMQMLADAQIPLTILAVQETKITGKGVKSIGLMSTLERLELNRDVEIDPSALQPLGELKRLTNLNLDHALVKRCKDQDFAFIARLRLLRYLNLSGSPHLPPRVFKYAERLPELKTIECVGSGLTDESLGDIGNIDSLENLYIVNDEYTDAGIAKLTRLTGLTVLGCSGAGITKASFTSFVAMRNLVKLNLHKTPNISSEDVSRLQGMMPQCQISLLAK